MKKLLHIGTVELVSLPDDEIQSVPAKVDTGADGSAIWASSIKQRHGELQFNFFAPGSAYYSKQPIVTTAFKTINVKNSFGHTELRYKVKLNVKIGDYEFQEWFSLADRSRNTYPILIGKNCLENRFVVDVSRRYLVSREVDEHTVLVLDRSPKLTKDFFSKVQKLNQLSLDYKTAGYKDLLFCLNTPETKVINTADQHLDISHYGFTYFKSHTSYTEFALAVAEYLQFKGRPFVDRELTDYVSGTKLTEAMKLASYRLPIPPTICAATSTLSSRYQEIADLLGVPFVLKEISSDRAKNNYLISGEAKFKQLLEAAPPEHVYLAQRYIEHDALVRVYVAGNKAKLAVECKNKVIDRQKLRSHLHQFSAEGKTRTFTPEKSLAETAVQAARCLDRQIAGVDMVKDKNDEKWYILEVNSAPQLRSGPFLKEKATLVAEFFDEELRR
jgi:glutathione synthase/RimK-type ligase-like ATP-grasp enzyme